MLTDLHINSDFISDDDILKGMLSDYKVLILPCSYIISPECAEKIEEFVRGGGRVIADYILAEKMPGGFCYTSLPGGGLDRVFGIEREDVLYIAHPTMCKENTYGIGVGSFVEEIIPVDAKSIDGDYGENYPLLTENKYHNGTANYIATQYFSRYAQNPTKTLRDRIRTLVGESGVKPYASFVNEDEKDLESIITSALMDEQGEIKVVTVSNVDYTPICDAIRLPKASYASVEEGAKVSFEEFEDYVEVKFELSAFESVALYVADR